MKPVSMNSVAVKRRNSRAVDRRGSSVARDREDDSSSISTLDQTAKQWMVSWTFLGNINANPVMQVLPVFG